MSADALERLRTALGGYRIERELGGGGMSRVFFAEETTLHRQVGLTVALIALGARDTTRALEYLERSARAREAVSYMAPFGLPAYDPIRQSARFAAVIRAFGADPMPFIRRSAARQ